MSIGRRVQTEVRSLARRLGIIGVLSRARTKLQPAQSNSYEAKLRSAMERAVRPGDVVWDVGANVGLYTQFFAGQVGASGFVAAFEPAPACFDALRQRTACLAQVKPFNFALGRDDGFLPFEVAPDPLATTHTLALTSSSTKVRVARAESLVASGEAMAPNVMKIDVEGFEEEVVDGAIALLQRRDLRAVFVEVHFGILEQRGRKHAPSSLVEKFQQCGLTTKWLSVSHLAALR